MTPVINHRYRCAHSTQPLNEWTVVAVTDNRVLLRLDKLGPEAFREGYRLGLPTEVSRGRFENEAFGWKEAGGK